MARFLWLVPTGSQINLVPLGFHYSNISGASKFEYIHIVVEELSVAAS